MGMQGPLTAQALGRSPYDDVVEGEGVEDSRRPQQQYDYRGRPINPQTRRLNRDIVRSHNEVMLVIGVAEPENPYSGPEAESRRRHEAYEESYGIALASSAKRCVEAVGIFGVHGLRQRILIYKRYSQIPFWELYQNAQKQFSFSRDVFAGAPTQIITNLVDRYVGYFWAGKTTTMLARNLLVGAWFYIRLHLKLFVALQHLDLVPNKMLLPGLKFFIPFTATSPIPAPPALEGFTLPSLMRWLGGAAMSVMPFFVWALTEKTIFDWRPQVWSQIFRRLPNTMFQRTRLPSLPALPPSPSLPPQLTQRAEESGGQAAQIPQHDNVEEAREPVEHNTERDQDHRTREEAARRASIFSARGDDDESDDGDNEGVSATLISFDVEATESSDTPPGLWSAELRPSVAPEPRSTAAHQSLYFDTCLTQLPPLIGSDILTYSVVRILSAPYEATALRMVARAFRLRQNLPCDDISSVNLLSGLTWTFAVNFFGLEFLHLALSGEIWAIFTFISQCLHMTEEEWKATEEGKV